MAGWYLQLCERCGGAIRHGQVMKPAEVWMHADADKCREIIEDEAMKALQAKVMRLRPDESGRISKGLVLAIIMGEVE